MLKENITVEMTGMRVAIKLAGITSEMKEKILETKRKPLYPDSYPNNSQREIREPPIQTKTTDDENGKHAVTNMIKRSAINPIKIE